MMAAIKRSFDDILEPILYWNAEVKDKAFQLMQSYSILPTDAFHIATALSHSITAFATLDKDFLKVDGITVYTCLPDF